MARAYDTILAADFANVPVRLDQTCESPLFHQIEAEIHADYRHDHEASYAASARLLASAAAGEVHEPALASVQARLDMAVQLDRLGDAPAAIDLLETVSADRPARPHAPRHRRRR